MQMCWWESGHIIKFNLSANPRLVYNPCHDQVSSLSIMIRTLEQTHLILHHLSISVFSGPLKFSQLIILASNVFEFGGRV